jgi:hypothetical protein
MTNLALGVYRRLDNRFVNEDDQSPFGFELHSRRRAALHAVFDGDPEFRVEDWGDADDRERSHEFVELTLALAVKAFHYAVVPGLIWLGKKLADKGVDEVLSEAVKAIVAKLRGKQEAKQILDFQIRLPDGTIVSVDPPDRDATIRIAFNDGKVEVDVYQQPVNSDLSGGNKSTA